MTLRINKAEYEATVDKVAKINARAIKRGFTGRLEVVATQVEVKTKDLYGMRRTEVFYDTDITGEAPKYAGWEFLAILDWDTASDLIVRAAPGVENIDRSLLTRDQCDHCGTHRQRKNIYLVRNVETGLQVQVGSSCIKDFLGHDTNIVFLDRDGVEAMADLGSYGLGAPDTFGTQYVLAIAWALIKLDGFRPANSFGSTTKGDVLDVLTPPRNMTPDRRAELARIRDLAHEAMDRAQECLAWVLSDDFKGDSDYVTNLKVIAASDHVGLGGVGLLASAPQTWARWQEKTLIKETEKLPSNWVGAVGDKLTFTATIKSIRHIPGDYGTKTLYTMRTEAGDIVKWFCSGRNDLGDQVGRQVTFKATVKAHDTFRDIKETLVTRAKEVKA